MTFRKDNRRAAVLTPAHVVEIRQRYEMGESQGSLARAFGKSVNHIGRIVRGESWQGVGETTQDAEASQERFRQLMEEDVGKAREKDGSKALDGLEGGE